MTFPILRIFRRQANDPKIKSIKKQPHSSEKDCHKTERVNLAVNSYCIIKKQSKQTDKLMLILLPGGFSHFPLVCRTCGSVNKFCRGVVKARCSRVLEGMGMEMGMVGAPEPSVKHLETFWSMANS